MQKIGIVGCGIMGSGIAQICAQKGYEVCITEKNGNVLERGLNLISATLQKLTEKARITAQDQADVMARIHGTSSLDQLADCDLVIEAVTEDLELKKRIFTSLDTICKPETILATNTSVLPVIEMAQATSRPEKVIGTHFLTPPAVIPLLELVRTIATSPETLSALREFGVRLGKKVIIAEDRPGFIVNRILTSIMLDAVRLLEEGVGSKEDIDTAVQDGLGLPMGPFRLLDLIGMDTIVAGCSSMHNELNNPHYACPITIRRMVQAGLLGRKTGKGFYEY